MTRNEFKMALKYRAGHAIIDAITPLGEDGLEFNPMFRPDIIADGIEHPMLKVRARNGVLEGRIEGVDTWIPFTLNRKDSRFVDGEILGEFISAHSIFTA